MNLLQKLREAQPKKSVIFTALETLKDSLEIRQFYQEYSEYLKRYGNSKRVRVNSVAVANSNIGYAIGYYDESTADRWFGVLPDISHPIFGRDIFSVSLEDAYKAGQIMGRKGEESAKRYIKQRRK